MPKLNWHGIGAVFSVCGVAVAQSSQVPADWRGPISIALTMIAAVLINPGKVGLPFIVQELEQLLPQEGNWALAPVGPPDRPYATIPAVDLGASPIVPPTGGSAISPTPPLQVAVTHIQSPENQ